MYASSQKWVNNNLYVSGTKHLALCNLKWTILLVRRFSTAPNCHEFCTEALIYSVVDLCVVYTTRSFYLLLSIDMDVCLLLYGYIIILYSQNLTFKCNQNRNMVDEKKNAKRLYPNVVQRQNIISDISINNWILTR